MRPLSVRHARFLLAFGLGLAVAAAALALPVPTSVHALIGVNSFFLSYLLLMVGVAVGASPDLLRSHADAADEGPQMIVLLAATSVIVSIGAILMLLGTPGVGWLAAALGFAAIPLGWTMVHTMAAFHYAHLFYSATDRSSPRADRGGLVFPGAEEPDGWDFLYFSFVVGMTAQVSDVVVTDPGLRRVVLFHAVAAFFYNTVILALAVNAAVSLGG